MEPKIEDWYCTRCLKAVTYVYMDDRPILFSKRLCPNCKTHTMRPKYPTVQFTHVQAYKPQPFLRPAIEKIYKDFGETLQQSAFALLEKTPYSTAGWRADRVCSRCGTVNSGCMCEADYHLGWKTASTFWSWADVL